MKVRPPIGKSRGVDTKEGFEGVRLENHLRRRRRSSFVMHDTWLCPWSIEKEGRWADGAPRMGDDLFKSRPPVVLVKDNPRHAIGRDLYGQCFLAGIFNDPKALHIVFEDFRDRKNDKLN